MTATETPVLSITRQFKASRERVFAAFTTIDAMMSWFGPPGCDIQGGSLDFRVGGGYQLRIKTSEGEMAVVGEYREIEPPQRLVFTWKWQDDEDWTELESVVTLEFHANGNETELRFKQTGFPSVDSRDRHEEGWCGSFDKLKGALTIS